MRQKVKAAAPELLRSKKRGSRGGIRNKLRQLKWQGKVRIPLPTILLSNARSLIKNFDHLESISNQKLLHDCCIFAFTETWFTSNISDQQIDLSGYTVIRADRSLDSSGKTKGGGLSFYINDNWARSVKVISNHIEPNLEMLSICVRPYWSPREISCIVLLLVHAIVFDSSQSAVVKATVNKIHEQIDTLERSYPNCTLYALGDFNSAYIKLPRFKQQVTCTTRENKTLDKCYVTSRAQCYKSIKLPPLGSSDHNTVFLLPKYTPVSKSTPKQITKQIWSTSNIDKLLNCLEDTDWATLLNNDDINATEKFSSYILFCIEQCIPSITVRDRNDKQWMNGKIRRLVAERCSALSNNDTTAVRDLKTAIQREIRHAKTEYAKSIESKLKSKPCDAWKSLNAVLKLKPSVSGCNLDPNELNVFL